MNFFHSIAGMVHLELISAALNETVGSLNAEGITLFHYWQEDLLTGRFWIRRQDLGKAQIVCAHYEGTVRILEKNGIFWSIHRILSRPILLSGVAAVFFFYLLIPSRIFFVKAEGNRTVPTRQILSEAEKCGIAFGVSREVVRSEKIKNALLERIPQLQWVGVNTSGCVATISVTERNTDQVAEDTIGVSSLYASRDGYILSATATKGSLVVQPGNTVKEGQLLISGLTDCGIAIRAERAEGEIYAQTSRLLNVIMLQDKRLIHTSGTDRKKISLILGKKRINLWKDSGISVDSCGRMYTEYYVTLPRGFQLPVALCKETYHRREEEACFLSREEAVPELQRSADRQLTQRMIAGEILQRKESISKENGCWKLTGSYVCREMIGRLRQETEWRNEWQKQLNGSSAPSG